MWFLLACQSTPPAPEEPKKVDAELVAGLFDVCLGKEGHYQCQFVDAVSYDYGQHEIPEGVHGLSLGIAGSCWLNPDQSIGCRGFNAQNNLKHALGAFQSVSVGEVHSCGLGVDGQISCWGAKQWGLLDEPNGTYASVAVHGYNTCATNLDGTLFCWGWVQTGVLDGIPAVPITEVSGISYNVCAITEDKEIVCWGTDAFGLLNSPKGACYHSIAVGIEVACALNEEDEPVCWGSSEWGLDNYPPGKFQKLVVGGRAICGLRYDGRVDCWGCRGDEATCTWGVGTEPYLTIEENGRSFFP